MSRASILSPLRIIAYPRPAIQAWRSARCFATEVLTPSAHSASPIPAVSSSGLSSFTQTSLPAQEATQVELPGLDEITASSVSASASGSPKKLPVGVVVSAGKMQKTVKVRIPQQKFNRHIGKYYKDHSDHLVHDPNSSLNAGDVVSLRPHRSAKHVHHVVNEILVPFGKPIQDRAPVPSEADIAAEYAAMRAEKLYRRSMRRAAAEGSEAAIEELKAMGLGSGYGAEAGAGEGKGKKGASGRKGQRKQ